MNCDKWMADGVNITAVCEAADWHLATAAAKLQESGFAQDDAEAFVNFVFNEAAIQSGQAVDCPSEDFVTQEQWDRLSI